MSESEIPADIRETAWKMICCQPCVEVVCSFQNGCGCFDALAAALLAERERCARIADAVGRTALHPDASAIAGAVAGTASTIAAAIRKPES